MIFKTVKNNLDELISLVNQLTFEEFSKPITELQNSTIGAHTRHTIELFQCLLNQYEEGIINYDLRNRNVLIENDKEIALNTIYEIQNTLLKKDKALLLVTKLEDEEIQLQTNYLRELYYNYEHSIHHLALIKVAIFTMSHIKIPENFGVAHSTVKYRSKTSSV